MKPSGELFLERKQSRRLGVDVREASRKPRGREARPSPLGAPPTLVGSPGLSWPNSFTPGASFGLEKIIKNWHVNWTPFGIPFL